MSLKLLSIISYRLGLQLRSFKARHETWVLMIKARHDLINRYISLNRKSFCCQAPYDQEACDIFVLGSLVAQLQRIKLWPGDPETIACNMKLWVGGGSSSTSIPCFHHIMP